MISKKRAVEIANKLYGSRSGLEYSVRDAEGSNIQIYGDYNLPALWLVKVSDEQGEHLLESTTIVLIDKKTGEVVFNGKAMDEG